MSSRRCPKSWTSGTATTAPSSASTPSRRSSLAWISRPTRPWKTSTGRMSCAFVRRTRDEGAIVITLRQIKYAVIGFGVLVAAAVPAAALAADPDWKAVEQALGKSGQIQPGDVFRIGMPRPDLNVSGTRLGGGPPAAAPAPGPALDTKAIEQALGRSGRDVGAGVFQVTVPRAEAITEMGQALLPAMGVVTVMNFQPTSDGKAAITGDFVLIDQEVNAVAKTLGQHGVDVTAIHNHALLDMPRLFYMHFWANDDPTKLAQALKAALDHTNSRK